MAPRAANVGRLDLVTYFIEEKGIRVNSYKDGEEALLAKHFDARKKDHDDWGLPLQGALMISDKEIVDYLMDRMRKEVNTQGFRGRTSLMDATFRGNLSAVKRLVELFGANTEAVGCEGCTVLCYAVHGGHVEVIDFFLEHARSKGGEERLQTLIKNCCSCDTDPSLMYRAILCNSLPTIQCILGKAGKESTLYSLMNAERGAIFYPTHFATCLSSLLILKWLFSQGVPVDLVTSTHNCTALHYACGWMDDDEEKLLGVVRFLVEKCMPTFISRIPTEA